MSDLYNEGFDDGYKAAKKDYHVGKVHDALVDAAVMLAEIERARALPGFANVQAQYVALGREIMALIKTLPHDNQHERSRETT